MNTQTKLIEQILNEILSKKNLIYEAEALMAPVPMSANAKSNFGQKRSYEIHPGMDIGCVVGTKVSAMSDGKVETANFNFNRLCGATIDIMYDNGFWSRFCHLSKIDVTQGQRVVQGQVVGLSGGIENAPGAGNSKGPHLHVTLTKGGVSGQKLNPVDYINKSNAPVQGTTQTTSGTTMTNPLSPNEIDPDTRYYKPKEIDPDTRYYQPNSVQNESYSLISEEKIYGSFGNGASTSSNGYTVTIPKDKNPKIKSPVDGVIRKKNSSYGCKNQIDIVHEVNGEEFYLEYCGLKSTKDSGDVFKSEIIGQIGDDDIRVTLYNSSKERVPIGYYKEKESSGKKNSFKSKKNSFKSKKIEIDKSYYPAKGTDVDTRYFTTRNIDPDEVYSFKGISKDNSMREDYRIQKNITKIRKLLK